ncbi:hypothetical protein [Arthrobacter sp. StoSoilB22]|uniref:hypothetical protein n=1 Tax=Arthrobacter sp. StoSoilB22 TaxID=2830996 RepID=UPI001CC57CAF|nr:hypothetical protein [Arthrobacter sp. StoSoilB22]BCW61843.1 hypothetical protein StoSoilB22_08160 [Arthrobacter sp. StoSoilB22]
MTDSPNIQFSIAGVRKEIVKAEVLKVGLSNSKVITFPDLYAMESSEAESIFGRLNQNATNWKVIRTWLSLEDADALKAEKLSVIELSTVMRRAVRYYEDIYGTAGEGNASEG